MQKSPTGAGLARTILFAALGCVCTLPAQGSGIGDEASADSPATSKPDQIEIETESAPAVTDRPSPGKSVGAAGQIEEIVVTASKRSLSLQDTKMSITAFSGQDLEDRGADDVEDYIREVPGVAFTDLGPGNKKIIMRGVSTSAFSTSNVQATVAQYVDEMVISDAAGAQLDLKLFDIERVEVLRGPQGTLYGAGSMGGALRVITNKPDPTDAYSKASLTTSYTEGGGFNQAGNFMFNVPLGDRLAFRAIGYLRHEDGFIDQRATDAHPDPSLNKDNINTDETYGARLALGFDATDRFTLRANAMVQATDLGMALWRYSRDLGDLISINPTHEEQLDLAVLGNLTAEYDFGWAALVSATSAMQGDREQVIANHEAANVQTRAFFAPAVDDFQNTSEVISDVDDRVFSHELRLVSPDSSRLTWLGGIYYQRATTQFLSEISVPEDFTDPRVAPVVLALDARPMLNPLVLRELIGKELRQAAVFGEVGLPLGERWGALIGARAFRTEFERNNWQDGAVIVAVRTLAGQPDGATGPQISFRKTSENVITPKFQLAFEPSDDQLYFFTVAQGFRVGGVNPADPSVPEGSIPVDFQSDTLWNYELSAKTQWFDRRLTLNGSIYAIDWSDIQLPTIAPSGFAQIINGGDATVLGTELELTQALPWGSTVKGTLSFTQAEFAGEVPPLGAVKGDPLPGTPDWSGSLALEHETQLFGAVPAFARLNYQYVGESFVASSAAAREQLDLRMGDYGLLNLQFSVVGAGWEVNAFVNNLTDERARLGVTPILSQLTITGRPRTFGLTLKLPFE